MDRGPQIVGPVLAVLIRRRVREPGGLVVGPANPSADAHGETLRQGHRHTRLQVLAVVAVSHRLGPRAPVSGRGIEPYRGRKHPTGAEREILHRSVEQFPRTVPPVVPRGIPVDRKPPAEAVARGHPPAEVKTVGFVGVPLMPPITQHAKLRGPGHEHPRAHVPRHQHPVEPPARVLPPRGVHAQP